MSDRPLRSRRVVVTGLGIISPLGNDLASSWDGIVNGRSGIGPITHFDASAFTTRIAGEVRDFDVTQWVSAKDARKMEAFIHYGVAASMMAMADADLIVDESNAERIGALIGSGIGGLVGIEEQTIKYHEGGVGHRHHRSGDTVVDERLHLPGVLGRHPPGNVEIADFTRDAGRECGRIEVGDRANARATVDDAVPAACQVVAERGNDAEAGDDDTPGTQGTIGHGTLQRGPAPACAGWHTRRGKSGRDADRTPRTGGRDTARTP